MRKSGLQIRRKFGINGSPRNVGCVMHSSSDVNSEFRVIYTIRLTSDGVGIYHHHTPTTFAHHLTMERGDDISRT